MQLLDAQCFYFDYILLNSGKSLTFESCLFTRQRETVSFIILSKDIDFIGGEGIKMGKDSCVGIAGQSQGNVVSGDIFRLAET